MPRTCSNDASNKLDYQRIIRLTPSGRPASRIFWKMTAPSKPLNASPGTPIAGPRNSMTAADRRFCSRIWKGFDIDPGWNFSSNAKDYFRVSAFNSRENASGCRPFSADCSGTIGSRVWPHMASAPSFALAFVVRSCLALRKAIPELCGQNLRCCFS
jgi:hypothetical protein